MRRSGRGRPAPEPVLHLAYVCSDSGIAALGTKGASVHLRSICEALRRAGCHLTLHCTRLGGEEAQCSAFTDRCVEHPAPEELRKLQRQVRDFYGPELRLPAEVRQCLLNREMAPRLEQLWKARRPDAVLERLSLFGVAAFRAARRLQIPHLLEVNALLSEEARLHRSLHDYEAACRAENEVLQGSDRVFCVSNTLRDQVVARGADPQRVEVLPNGFDERRFRPRPATALRRRLGLEDVFTVGMVGSLKPWHGVATLLEAFRQFAGRRRAALLIVGQGPESACVEAFARAHPQLRVIAPGAIPHNEVPSWIAACDVATAPYEADENFYFSPMKVYEYMAMGVPVVATRQGQLLEVIEDGRSGLLVPPGDAEALAAALGRLRRSADLRRRLGEAGRRQVAGRTWLANARRIRGAVQDLTP